MNNCDIMYYQIMNNLEESGENCNENLIFKY